MGGLFARCKDACSPGAGKSNGYEAVVDSDWAEAVRSGNMDQLQHLYSQDGELIKVPVDTYGRKALHLSVNKGHHEVVFWLLSEEANVNEKAGRDDDTPLHEACKVNDEELINLLIRFGADINETNRQRKYALDVCDAKTKREFTKEKIAHLQSLGRPKSYKAMSNSLDQMQGTGHVVKVTPPVVKKNNNGNNNSPNGHDDDENSNDNSMNAIELSQSQSLSASYSSSWSDSDSNVRLSIGQKVEWNSSAFSQQFGVELADVTRFLKSKKSKSILEAIWDRIIKDSKQPKLRNSDEQLFKLTYAVVFAAAKTQDRTKQSIPKEPVKKIAKKVKKELVSRFNATATTASTDYELTKQQFVYEFGDLLEIAHQSTPSN
ncbi:ankyrin repeat protein [Reticulomyxa filosa]|uniref:Ankyrin repeat protein n=1 Tax=Reticulomyxa filosa TaxID=46433 RepID=X6P9Q4_RETFI|nr:ankyrin repeat protein [Reticulomyxa filosa]|eukprot:ETO34853.1 ankyrin repeat protein [Reticulomyxa filosa]